jgi:hypothetical protein
MCGKLMHDINTKNKDVLVSSDPCGLRKKNKNNTKAPILKGSAFLKSVRLF